MRRKILSPMMQFILALILISAACAVFQPQPAGTPEPTSTMTSTPTATRTPRPSPTLRPTRTPDVAATQHAEQLVAEVQSYYEKGYLATTDGRFTELEDFSYDWAQLGSYRFTLIDLQNSASDFVLSGHFKWDSALQNSGTAGCGFIFGLQPNDDHYAVFLDRTQIFFRIRNPALGYSSDVKPIRVLRPVKFDYPAAADFTLIVKGTSAYVLVDGEAVSEYTLLQGRPLRGNIGLAVLSGTNKDYGTRCEMTNLHLWVPND